MHTPHTEWPCLTQGSNPGLSYSEATALSTHPAWWVTYISEHQSCRELFVARFNACHVSLPSPPSPEVSWKWSCGTSRGTESTCMRVNRRSSGRKIGTAWWAELHYTCKWVPACQRAAHPRAFCSYTSAAPKISGENSFFTAFYSALRDCFRLPAHCSNFRYIWQKKGEKKNIWHSEWWKNTFTRIYTNTMMFV